MELSISREEIDNLAGIATGYSGKLLSPARTKVFGKVSLGPTLGAIGCKLILVEDPAAAARTLARRKIVDQSNQRFGNKSRASAGEKGSRRTPDEATGGKYG
jgi:hypothetical protein